MPQSSCAVERRRRCRGSGPRTRKRAFWAKHDVVDYLRTGPAVVRRSPNLKPSTTTILDSIAGAMLEELRRLANERDVPYQSLIEVYLAERIRADATDQASGAGLDA